ncbi:MAG: stage sporulation protein [Sedimentibacter sp.]|jgi:AbrB family looped-hinge helix DNA binding protein|nr:stage sporulation protein [Sedimentibacter sp.]
MKSTGIVRRVDDLGRIVIPKELRRLMLVKEGDPLEIFTDNGIICMRKFDPIPLSPDDIDFIMNVVSYEDADVDSRERILSFLKSLKESLIISNQY